MSSKSFVQRPHHCIQQTITLPQIQGALMVIVFSDKNHWAARNVLEMTWIYQRRKTVNTFF